MVKITSFNYWLEVYVEPLMYKHNLTEEQAINIIDDVNTINRCWTANTEDFIEFWKSKKKEENQGK